VTAKCVYNEPLTTVVVEDAEKSGEAVESPVLPPNDSPLAAPETAKDIQANELIVMVSNE
jgi:hypothetical protein